MYYMLGVFYVRNMFISTYLTQKYILISISLTFRFDQRPNVLNLCDLCQSLFFIKICLMLLFLQPLS